MKGLGTPDSLTQISRTAIVFLAAVNHGVTHGVNIALAYGLKTERTVYGNLEAGNRLSDAAIIAHSIGTVVEVLF